MGDNMEMIMNTIRMIDHDQKKEYSIGDNLSLKENLAIGLINSEDFQKLNLSEGLNIKLTNNYINAMAIDESGCKWLATNDGLVKFDGANWVTYNDDNSDLPEDCIIALTIDDDNNKWIGSWSTGGLIKFKNSYWTIYNSSNSGLPSDRVSAIAKDKNGNLWIGCPWGGLAKLDGTTWKVYNSNNSGLPNNAIWAIAIDQKGDIFI